MSYPLVLKSDGSQEVFDPEKLRSSLLKSGAPESDAGAVVDHIVAELKDGTTTEFIYSHAFELLKQTKEGVAARYSLRRALADLGPSGFPFEQFVAGLFRKDGYEVEVGRVLEGECVTHEIDVLGHREGEWVVGEAKFHKQSHIKSDIQVALYVHARFNDLKRDNFMGLDKDKEPRRVLITNTKFTSHAIAYGTCVGLEMIGWSYPDTGNLQELIDEAMLQPITMLTKLSGAEKQLLLKYNYVLCRELRDNPKVLDEIGIEEERQAGVLEEVRAVCHL